eukprot:6679489-Prorocentrum_lima.AAC.1
MSPRLYAEVAERCQRVLGSNKRFKHLAESALMASRQGEQHALMNCGRTEQLMLSEYHQKIEALSRGGESR